MNYKDVAISLMKRLHEESRNALFTSDELLLENYSKSIAKLHSVTLTDEGKEILAQQLMMLNKYSKRPEIKGCSLLHIADAIATLIGG